MEEIKQGRPTKYSKKLIKKILERLAKGEPIRNAVKDEEISWATFRSWLITNKDGLRQQYTLAKQDGIEWSIGDLETIAMQTVSRSRDKKADISEVKAVSELIKHRQWKAQKLFPRVYGDKTQMEVSGGDKAIEIKWETDKD